MDSHAATEPIFEFIGDNLCLDFANTVGGLPPESITQDRLTIYPRLVEWSQQTNLISASEADVLLRKAARAPQEASDVLERAHILRAAIHGIFIAISRGTQPAEHDLDLLNIELEKGMAGARVIVTSEGFSLGWRKAEGELDQMLAPIARSAATLLTSPELQFVRKCAHDLCPWLFVDTTKNHRRQWCKTSGCGNLMRVRKHRKLQRTKDDSSDL